MPALSESNTPSKTSMNGIGPNVTILRRTFTVYGLNTVPKIKYRDSLQKHGKFHTRTEFLIYHLSKQKNVPFSCIHLVPRMYNPRRQNFTATYTTTRYGLFHSTTGCCCDNRAILMDSEIHQISDSSINLNLTFPH